MYFKIRILCSKRQFTFHKLLAADDNISDEEDEKDMGANATKAKKRKFRVNEKGETPLHVAAKKGDIKNLRRLIRQVTNIFESIRR